MRLGIDFGTTRIAVAAVDRGNYPVVRFETADGVTEDWFPSVVAVRGQERRYGWDAFALQADPEWTVVRSLKRYFQGAGPHTQVQIGEQSFPMRLLLHELTAKLRHELLHHSTLTADKKEEFSTYLGVPANANSNQRFLAVEAFRESNYNVLGLLNEPSAASIEYSHYARSAAKPKEGSLLLVYDLGGGTFDASLVELGKRAHTVLGNEGVPSLGGDDFDDILAELVIEHSGIAETEIDSLSQSEVFRLHEECRHRKEALHPSSRKLVVELDAVREGWKEISLPVGEFYENCRPLVDQTLEAVHQLLARHGIGPTGVSEKDGRRLEAVYVAGGGSELPIIPRGLREYFGRRVRRSAHTRSTTAIGLAIQADHTSGYTVRERFTRYFGVWREADSGGSITFDPLFLKETPLPASEEPPLTINRRYSPVHNIGHFRYLESSHINEQGQPSGDIMLWDDIRFPFEPALEGENKLESIAVNPSPEAHRQSVEEAYRCDSGGTVTLTITNHTNGYSRDFRLGRWSTQTEPIRPGGKLRRKRRKKARAAKAGN